MIASPVRAAKLSSSQVADTVHLIWDPESAEPNVQRHWKLGFEDSAQPTASARAAARIPTFFYVASELPIPITTVEPTREAIASQTSVRVRVLAPAHSFSAKPHSVENKMMDAM